MHVQFKPQAFGTGAFFASRMQNSFENVNGPQKVYMVTQNNGKIAKFYLLKLTGSNYDATLWTPAYDYMKDYKDLLVYRDPECPEFSVEHDRAGSENVPIALGYAWFPSDSIDETDITKNIGCVGLLKK